MIETHNQHNLDRTLSFIRTAVRQERAYLVGTAPNVQVKLNQNESPFDLPEDLKRELLDAFSEIPFNRYPTEQPDLLREALAAHVGHDPEGILVSNGSNELTYTFGLTMIERGTPVVLPRPMFSLYEKVVRLFEGALTPVPPLPDLRFDAAALLEAVRQTQPALVILTTPNNPTGRAMPLEEIEPLVEATPGFVVVDEAYVEFSEEVSAQTILERYPNLIVLRTLSKAFGLAGLRIGFLLAHPRVVHELLKARLPFMVDRLSELTALALLKYPALLQERIALLKASRRTLTDALNALDAVEVVPSQTNFVLFKTPVEPKIMLTCLAEAGVLVRNMSGYPELPGYLRVNAGTADENKAFLAALKNALLRT